MPKVTDSHYDALEARDPAQRERDMLSALPALIRRAQGTAAGAERLGRVDAASVTTRLAFARLPVLQQHPLQGPLSLNQSQEYRKTCCAGRSADCPCLPSPVPDPPRGE